MKRLVFILLCVFYVSSISIGFIPNVYEYDRVYFLANQAMWVYAFILMFMVAKTNPSEQSKIIIASLILLTIFELIDEYYNINSYLPMTIKGVLKLDATVCIAVTLFTIYKLYKSWQKEKLQTH